MANPCIDFTDKKILITGATRGIGLAIAEKFVALGGVAANISRGAMSINIGVKSFYADLSDADMLKKAAIDAVDYLGGLDVLVNNAALMFEEDNSAEDEVKWAQTISVNLTAPYLLSRFCIPHLAKTKGNIVNISSIEGLAANPRHLAYCASKSGLNGLTQALAIEYGEAGIRTNAVAPGWINTELNQTMIADKSADFLAQVGDIHPIKRIGKPEEVANMVAWLASDEASFVTGQIYPVDGGRLTKIALPNG